MRKFSYFNLYQDEIWNQIKFILESKNLDKIPNGLSNTLQLSI